MKVVIFTVPHPLTRSSDPSFKQFESNMMIQHNFANGSDTPDSIENITRAEQGRTEFISPSHGHNIVNKLFDDDWGA